MGVRRVLPMGAIALGAIDAEKVSSPPCRSTSDPHNHYIRLKLKNNYMILKAAITNSTNLTMPYALIALTIVLGIYGIFLALRLRRVKNRD